MISIVIITLNEEKNIKNLLRDLTKQTYKDFEVIIVDSNSIDNTNKAALSFKKKFPKFELIVLKKKGVSLGRNTGANKAKGEYIFFFDADINFEKDFLEKSVEQLRKKRLDAAGVYMKSSGNNMIDKLYYGVLDMTFFVLQKIYPHCVGSCMISTKKVHKKIKGFDTTITLAEDDDYVNRAGKVFKYGMINQSVYVSPRRFGKEGRLRVGIKYIMIFFYRLFIGEIKTDIFKYKFAHYDEKTK
ncbi:MAG: glycosyltransferase family 2 protein [Nanoarchaeota archaeon]|nr:glycosyltransferase family 2 protein [Nanoarchaeota archaeon]